jgi:hypothetical protein
LYPQKYPKSKDARLKDAIYKYTAAPLAFLFGAMTAQATARN